MRRYLNLYSNFTVIQFTKITNTLLTVEQIMTNFLISHYARWNIFNYADQYWFLYSTKINTFIKPTIYYTHK